MKDCANNVDWKPDINLSTYAIDDQTHPSKREKMHKKYISYARGF